MEKRESEKGTKKGWENGVRGEREAGQVSSRARGGEKEGEIREEMRRDKDEKRTMRPEDL